MASPNLVLLFLLFLQIKHFVVDFPLQTPYLYLNKGKLFHPGGWIHVAEHSFATLLILRLFGVPLDLAWVLALFEFFAHYAIDYVKVNLTKNARWSQYEGSFGLIIKSDHWFWALGFDQLAHQICYLIIAAYALG